MMNTAHTVVESITYKLKDALKAFCITPPDPLLLELSSRTTEVHLIRNRTSAWFTGELHRSIHVSPRKADGSVPCNPGDKIL